MGVGIGYWSIYGKWGTDTGAIILTCANPTSRSRPVQIEARRQDNITTLIIEGKVPNITSSDLPSGTGFNVVLEGYAQALTALTDTCDTASAKLAAACTACL